MSDVVTIGDATLYHGDCLEILPAIGDVDAVVTDPQYGVNLGAYTGTSKFENISYESTPDTEDYVKSVCVPAIEICLTRFGRLAMTPGNRCMWFYPKPDDVGIWYNPASTHRGKWGFSYVNSFIFFYGKDPKNIGKGMIPNSTSGACDSVAGIDHPCPKPVLFMNWLVDRTSIPGEIILDPFAGSGSTGVACVNTGRKFIGIEIERKYFDIACERIQAAYAQGRLFA